MKYFAAVIFLFLIFKLMCWIAEFILEVVKRIYLEMQWRNSLEYKYKNKIKEQGGTNENEEIE